MRKWLLILLILPCIACSASEITEDYLDIATNYCIYGKYHDAITYIEKIIQLEPSNTDAIELKNTIQRVLNPYSKSYLTSTDDNIKKAQYYKNIGEKEKFISTLSALDNNFWALYMLGDFYKENNDYKNGIIYFQKALTLKPNFSQCYLMLAQSYLKNNEYTNALNAIDKFLISNPNSDAAFAIRAEINLNLNYISEAENDIKKALNIEENITYLLLEAKILYFKGDFDKAWNKFNLLSRNIQTSEVFKYMGLCDLALKNYSGALLNLDKAIILSDEDKSLNSTYNSIKEILENEKKQKI